MGNQSKPVVIKAECGNCAAWQEVPKVGPVTIGAPRRGICYGCPPTPAAVYDPQTMRLIGQKDLRCQPPETDTCLLFTPRPDLLPAAPPPH